MRARSFAAWSLRSTGVCCRRSWSVDGQQHAVDRPARTRLAQQREKAVPRAGIGLRVRFLGRVAAGGVDEHGLVGEPPVAIARAADAANAGATHLLGQRKSEPGVEQRRGLAGARRADEDVPGQLVEKGAALPARSFAGRVLQHGERLAETLVERRQLAIRRARALGHAIDQCRIRATLLPEAEHAAQDQQQEENRDDDDADPDRIERARLADGDQRPDPPDDRRQRDDADQRQEHRMKQELEQLLHAALSKPSGDVDLQGQVQMHGAPQAFDGTTSVISTRRLRARPAGVALESTGSASALPSAVMRLVTPESTSNDLTALARSCERCQFEG